MGGESDEHELRARIYVAGKDKTTQNSAFIRRQTRWENCMLSYKKQLVKPVL